MTPEGFVKKAVEDLLKAERIRYWRMNAGQTFIQGRRIRGHAKGTPDYLALLRLHDRVPANTLALAVAVSSTMCDFDGIEGDIDMPKIGALWIECKAPGKSPTKEQLQFADEARNNGEYWLCIDDVRQLDEWLKEMRAR